MTFTFLTVTFYEAFIHKLALQRRAALLRCRHAIFGDNPRRLAVRHREILLRNLSELLEEFAVLVPYCKQYLYKSVIGYFLSQN